MNEQVIWCRICGKPYGFYSMICRDQSMCPECEVAAKKAIRRDSTSREEQRRKNYFGGDLNVIPTEP